MRTNSVLTGLSLLGVVWLGAGAIAAQTQTPAAQKLSEAKSLRCTFSTMANGDWKDGAAVTETKASKMSIGFDDIEADEGTAVVLGSFGPADIIVRLSNGTLHFVQAFREGPLYATTIFPYELRPGVMRAAHTRHEYTIVQLPGFTSRPEQRYGECEITK